MLSFAVWLPCCQQQCGTWILYQRKLWGGWRVLTYHSLNDDEWWDIVICCLVAMSQWCGTWIHHWGSRGEGWCGWVMVAWHLSVIVASVPCGGVVVIGTSLCVVAISLYLCHGVVVVMVSCGSGGGGDDEIDGNDNEQWMMTLFITWCYSMYIHSTILLSPSIMCLLAPYIYTLHSLLLPSVVILIPDTDLSSAC